MESGYGVKNKRYGGRGVELRRGEAEECGSRRLELCGGGRGMAGNCVGQTNSLSHQLEVPAEGFGEAMGLICSATRYLLLAALD